MFVKFGCCFFAYGNVYLVWNIFDVDFLEVGGVKGSLLLLHVLVLSAATTIEILFREFGFENLAWLARLNLVYDGFISTYTSHVYCL